MKQWITLKKKSDPRKFTVPCVVQGIKFPHASRHRAAEESYPRAEEYDEDYKEEQAMEYNGLLAEGERIPHHSYRKWNAASIDGHHLPSIDYSPEI
ncbi:hypothetical protein Bca52824_023738 [Brassica carinata]|uniref:Uncharacterized protein n=1 Tax=Brassica carinata TaxID=52824 RepID=A0A8X7VJ08_BRACI|nr:hypothetical protein Bca52824_023738 [Brassica carinata]